MFTTTIHNPFPPYSFDNFNYATDSEYSLSCMLTNIQSIRNKVAEFQQLIHQHKPVIIDITESWCDSTISDIEISLAGYYLFREDRPVGMGGGVLLYCHHSLSVTPIHSLNNIGVEDSI